MSRKIIFAPEEFYHLYNRGNDKRIIFNHDRDRQRFVKLLYLCNGQKPFHFFYLDPGKEYEFDRGETLVDLVSYCLMPNHFHILAKEKTGNGISNFMHRLLTSYTMYFNKLNERKGRLFETNFQAKHIDSDEYLRYIHAYIHLNPIKIIEPNWKEPGFKNNSHINQYLQSYPYSSYLDWLNTNRIESKIINRKSYPHFESKGELEDYLYDWMNYHNEA